MKTLFYKYIITATILLFLWSCGNAPTPIHTARPDTIGNIDLNEFVLADTLVITQPKKELPTTSTRPQPVTKPPIAKSLPPTTDAMPEPKNNNKYTNNTPDDKLPTNTVDDNGRRQGLIGVDIPQEMKQGKVSFVKVYLLKSKKIKALTRKLSDDARNNLIVDTLVLADIANVTLTDPSGGKYFEITKQGNDNHDQLVEENERSQWQWGVTPLTAGSHKIVVTVTVKIKSKGQEYYKELETYNKAITIDANYGYSAMKFINEHWEWFAGTILVPIIAFFRKKLKALWLSFIARFKKKK